VDVTTWYPDTDFDGFGDPVGGEESCEPVEDRVTDNTDCDDSAPDVNPSGTEVCDGIDNDCDGNVDEDLKNGTIDTAVVGFEWWYGDQDGDGYGDPEEAIYGCQRSGYVDNAGDCDDTDDSVSPDAEEVCDEVDNNCSGEVDVDAADMLTCHLDSDGDGYGRDDEAYQLVGCTCPSGWVDNADDCDDAAAELTTDCR
ncbi:MAG: putative metal-binding motif-containing protein, partial [Myxococcota bacterium]|nr:putative metal-binding motif-containing protein [Myxococcota bacterium]